MLRISTGHAILAAVLALLGALVCVSDAYASSAPPSASVVQSTVRSVTGPELLEAALAKLRAVQLGSDAATMSVDVEGRTQSIRVDFADLVRGRGGLLSLFALPLLGGVALRVLNVLTRVFRG